MKISVKREVLLNAVNEAARGSTKRGTKPILSGVLIQAERDVLRLRATDLESEITVELPVADGVAIEQPGAIVLNATRLSQLLNAARGEMAEVTVSEAGRAEIVAGSRSRLVGSSLDEFPTPMEVPDNLVEIPGTEFAQALGRVLYAISKSPTRYAINGVSARSVKGGIEFGTTDGRAIAASTLKCKMPTMTDAILSSQFSREATRIAGNAGSNIGFSAKGMSVLAADGVVLSSRLVAGQFPNYQGVIPAKGGVAVTADRDAWLAAVAQAQVVVTDESYCLAIDIDALTISGETDIGRAVAEIEGADKGGGEGGRFGVDCRLITEMLKTSEDGRVTIEFHGERKPMVLREENWTGAIAPMQLQKRGEK